MEQLNKEIDTLYETLKRKEKIGIRIDNIRLLIPKQEAKIKTLKIRIAKELTDVVELENQNLYSLFQSILGNKQQQLEKERQEYLDAILKHKGAIENLAAMKEELTLLEQVYSSQFSVENDLEKLLVQREKKLLKTATHPLASSILSANKRIVNFKVKIGEIQQAIAEGRRTKKELQKMILDLDKIEIWGTSIKSNKQNPKSNQLVVRIERNVMKINKYLQRYEEELMDLSIHFRVDFRHQIAKIRNFLDEFVDSLITDWIVKKRISNALHIVERIFDKISQINAMLKQEIIKTEAFLNSEKEQKQLLLIKEA